jgi:hypothetical protein
MEPYGRYTAGFWFISVSLLCMIWWILSDVMSGYEELDEENTIARSGVLSAEPKFDSIAIDGIKRPYVEIAFRGSTDVYWFINCSYRENVPGQVRKLHEGDSLMLYVQPRNSNTYEIRQARSSNYKLTFYFFQYNRCAEHHTKISNPLLAEILLAIGVVIIISEYRAANRDERLAEVSAEELLDTKLPMELTSDPLTYVMRTLPYPMLTFVLAAYFLIAEGEQKAYASYTLLAISVGMLINNILIASTMRYVIDAEGVEATTDSLFSKKSSHRMKFKDIEDVSDVTLFFERRRKVGTIRLSQANNEEPPLSLIGIRNPLQVGKLIFDLAVAKRAGQV